MIGPAATFVLLGVIAVLTMVASALHGPALAASASSPRSRVRSSSPRDSRGYWPVVLYLAFVVGAAYGVARLRLWRWLALSRLPSAAMLWSWVLRRQRRPTSCP